MCRALVCFSKNLSKGEIEVPICVGLIFAFHMFNNKLHRDICHRDTSHTSSYDLLDPLVLCEVLLLILECLRDVEASIRYLWLLRDNSWAHIMEDLSLCFSVVMSCYQEVLF